MVTIICPSQDFVYTSYIPGIATGQGLSVAPEHDIHTAYKAARYVLIDDSYLQKEVAPFVFLSLARKEGTPCT